MSDYAIRTRNLTKYFGAKCVVRDLNLNVPRGSIYGFLGRNGSGKTTSLRMILGLLAPNWGTSTILGHDSQQLPPEARARIGYLAEGHPVCGWMRVKDAEAYQSRFYPLWNHDLFSSVLEFFRVDPKNRARSLSRGERAGLCLAMVLAPEPDVLVLDDPAIGLDPVARRSCWSPWYTPRARRIAPSSFPRTCWPTSSAWPITLPCSITAFCARNARSTPSAVACNNSFSPFPPSRRTRLSFAASFSPRSEATSFGSPW